MLISKKQLKEMLLFSYAHIDRKCDPRSRYYDPSFPKKVRIGNHRIGYSLREVNEYIEQLLKDRDDCSS